MGDKVTLRDGLTQLAGAARVRLSYVAELLPLDRPMCLAYRSVAAGDVLSDLLRGTELEPVVAGDDQVVLAPARRTTSSDAPTDEGNARRASVLDRVVVVGTLSDNAQRSVPISLDIVSRDKLAHEDNGSLAHLLDGNVPGMWMWQQSPTTLLARYGSIRGASSFGVSYPKIYIDGIEVANPLIVQQFDPSTIERVEVIRGPQGAALYGADANSGVINIVTRHDGAAAGRPAIAAREHGGRVGQPVRTAGGAHAAALARVSHRHRRTLGRTWPEHEHVRCVRTGCVCADDRGERGRARRRARRPCSPAPRASSRARGVPGEPAAARAHGGDRHPAR